MIERILNAGGKVVTIARNEGQLIKLKQKYPKVDILPGDVADRFDVQQCMKGVDGVFHLAAFKHVGLAETQSRECTKSNIIGSLNILEEAVNNNVEFVLGDFSLPFNFSNRSQTSKAIPIVSHTASNFF